MKSMSFTVFSYNATVLLIQPTQPITCAGKCDPTKPNRTKPMDGPNPRPSVGGTRGAKLNCCGSLDARETVKALRFLLIL